MVALEGKDLATACPTKLCEYQNVWSFLLIIDLKWPFLWHFLGLWRDFDEKWQINKNYRLDRQRLSYMVETHKKIAFFTVVCKIVHIFASVWCKTALGEVGVSLPWWCTDLVLVAPGYWSLFLNLKNLFIMEKWPLVIFP